MDPSQPSPDSYWKKCSSCKKPIAFGASYYVCSVSTCSGQRTGYVFCSMPCFEVHLPAARHRDAGGIKKIAPEANEEVPAPHNAWHAAHLAGGLRRRQQWSRRRGWRWRWRRRSSWNDSRKLHRHRQCRAGLGCAQRGRGPDRAIAAFRVLLACPRTPSVGRHSCPTPLTWICSVVIRT